MKKISFQLLMLFAICFTAKSQQDPMLSQYMFNGLFLNPAYAGSHKYWTSTLTYRNQWVGFDGSPKTAIAAVDGPLPGRNMGLGALFMHDQIGVTKQNTALVHYAYQLRFKDFGKLAFGAQAGISQFSARLTDLTVWDQDQVFQNDLSNKILPRFGVGAYWFSEKWYAGISIPTLFAYDYDKAFEVDVSRATFLRRHYLLTAGYVFTMNHWWKLKPSVLFKYVQNAPVEADINLSSVFLDQFWIGATYRTGDAVALLIEYQSPAYFRIGYSYDITTTKLRNHSSGSHEIMIGFDFGRNLVKVKTPRYF